MIVSSENYIKKLIEENLRIDKRKFDEYRDIEVKTGELENAEGSARVKIGNTQVIVGIKMSVGTPFPDTPDEGILIVNAELAPIASPAFEPGPPSEDAVELARVVDRGIRESKAIELEKLCIEAGEAVWIINIDIHVIDHDGNLLDAAGLAALAALKDTKIPKYEDEKVIREETTGELPVVDMPLPVTISKIAGKMLIDTNLEEENAADARIAIATNKDENLCAIQKIGTGHLTTKELEEAVNLSIGKGKELRKLVT